MGIFKNDIETCKGCGFGWLVSEMEDELCPHCQPLGTLFAGEVEDHEDVPSEAAGGLALEQALQANIGDITKRRN